MSIFKNMFKSLYCFDEYGEFVKLKMPYILIYILLLSIILMIYTMLPVAKRYCVNYGGGKGIIEKIVPEFEVSKEEGLKAEEKVIKSVLDAGKTVSVFDIIIDTNAEDVEISAKWFEENYSYKPIGGINPAMAFVTAKKTYLIYPQGLKEEESLKNTVVFSNYNLCKELNISNKEDVLKYSEYVDLTMCIFAFSVLMSYLFVLIMGILYLSLFVMIFLRLANKKMNFGDIFKITSFTTTPLIFFKGLVEVISFASVRAIGFEISVPSIVLIMIFVGYSLLIYKKSDIPCEEIKLNE